LFFSSRTTKISVDPEGYLTLDSLEALTKAFHRALKRGQEKERRGPEGVHLRQGLELRQSMERAKRFKPLVYRAKQ